jgi:putative ABC transport system substrate-binding protein
MRRREFIAFLGSAAAALPFGVSAQQTAMPVVGFLHSGSPGPFAHLVAAFRSGLSEAGFVEGKNVTIEFRWAGFQPGRLALLATDLVRRKVVVIVAMGGNAPALAAKAATTTIPIVFNGGDDPIRLGLVASLNRPGGNVTGVSLLLQEMEGKRLGLLRDLIPTATLIGFLVDPRNANVANQLKDAQEAAHAFGQQLHILNVSNERELDVAFTTLVELRAEALLLGASPFFVSRSDRIISFTARHRLPTIYFIREFAAAGGLMSYGTSVADGYRQVGLYTGRVLKGEKAADLPVMQPTKFELVINLKTAKALGLTVPPTLLARADEVIE